MTYFLDTNICIYYLNNSAVNLSNALEKMPFDSIKIPSMVAAELLFAAGKSIKREQNLKIFKTFLSLYEIVPFDAKAADYYSAARIQLERKGQLIGSNDLVIAATAMANGGSLVTHNVDRFSRISGLTVQDWTLEGTVT